MFTLKWRIRIRIRRTRSYLGRGRKNNLISEAGTSCLLHEVQKKKKKKKKKNV
jgi:hypothetical protein